MKAAFEAAFCFWSFNNSQIARFQCLIDLQASKYGRK
jgi:hypothetical protein